MAVPERAVDENGDALTDPGDVGPAGNPPRMASPATKARCPQPTSKRQLGMVSRVRTRAIVALRWSFVIRSATMLVYHGWRLTVSRKGSGSGSRAAGGWRSIRWRLFV